MTTGRKQLLGILAATALVTAGCGALDPFDDQPFDPVAWAAADSYGRAPMARDAIRQLPAGTPAARVRELLGEGRPVRVVDEMIPGERVDRFGNLLEHPETWVYYLGCWSGLGPYNFDDAYLYVHFGPDGLVAAAEVTGG